MNHVSDWPSVGFSLALNLRLGCLPQSSLETGNSEIQNNWLLARHTHRYTQCFES